MGLQSIVQKYCTTTPILVWSRKPALSSGKPDYNLEPVVVTCRWDDKQINVIGSNGRVVTSNAMIMTPTQILIGSWIFKGSLDDWKALNNYPKVPTPLQGGYEVIAVNHNPDFRGQELLYSVFV